jgi:hypothetical protein
MSMQCLRVLQRGSPIGFHELADMEVEVEEVIEGWGGLRKKEETE